jgi:hypothetical protein
MTSARAWQVLIETGMVLWRQGNYAEARERLNEGLALAQEAGDTVEAWRWR